MLVNLITPEADKLKYWDKTKNKNLNTKLHVSLNLGQKEVLNSVLEKLMICFVRLRLGLMSKQLADLFSVSQAQVSGSFTTWGCFLATLFKDIPKYFGLAKMRLRKIFLGLLPEVSKHTDN